MTMQQKRSSTPGKMPLAADLADGQIALNTADGLVFIKNANGDVIRVRTQLSEAVAATLREPTLAEFRAAVGVFGDGQAWSDMTASRAANVAYENTAGRPISLAITAKADGTRMVEVSADGATWVPVTQLPAAAGIGLSATVTVLVPPGHHYRLNGTSATIDLWAELR